MGWPRDTSSFPEPTSWNGDEQFDTGDPIADCDCCGKHRPVSKLWAFGIETWACEECRECEP